MNENIRRFQARLAEAADEPSRRWLENMILAAERELALFDAEHQGVRKSWDKIAPAELQAARAEKIAWFRTEFADAPFLAALIDPEPGLVMVEINRTYEIASGVTREQVAGQPLFAAFPDNPEDPDADGVRNLYASLCAVAESGQPHVMDLQRYDTPDENGVWTARYWRPLNKPLLDDKGRLVFLLHLVEEAIDAAPMSGAAH